jgi:hypothetical protein
MLVKTGQDISFNALWGVLIAEKPIKSSAQKHIRKKSTFGYSINGHQYSEKKMTPS